MPGRSRERQWQPCRVTSSSLLSRTEDSAFVISGFGQVSHRNDLKKPDWQFILQDAENLKEVLLNCLKFPQGVLESVLRRARLEQNQDCSYDGQGHHQQS